MKKILILIENLFNEKEFIYPYHRLREDYTVVIAGTDKDTTYTSKAGVSFTSDAATRDIDVTEYAGLFIPGGYAPDYMRRHSATVQLVKNFVEGGKPTAVICHAGWVLASADVLKGRDVTSFFSIKDDLIHAGANWLDEEVVVSDNLFTSRNPGDLPALVKRFTQELQK